MWDLAQALQQEGHVPELAACLLCSAGGDDIVVDGTVRIPLLKSELSRCIELR